MSTNLLIGSPKRLTSSGVVNAVSGRLIGFYVASTSAGTIVLYDNASAGSGTQLSGTITPAVGWHSFPVGFTNGCYATLGGTIDVTFSYL